MEEYRLIRRYHSHRICRRLQEIRHHLCIRKVIRISLALSCFQSPYYRNNPSRRMQMLSHSYEYLQTIYTVSYAKGIHYYVPECKLVTKKLNDEGL